MRKYFVPALVLVLLLAIVTPVAARGGGDITRLNGEIEAIDTIARTFSLRVTSGGAYMGELITVQTTKTTDFLLKIDDGCAEITFAYLEVGQSVGVTGVFSGDILVAKKVVVQVDV